MLADRPAGDRRPVGTLLATLLQPREFNWNSGCAALRPLWAEEVMHRGHNFLRLAALLERQAPLLGNPDITLAAELALAADIAFVYRAIGSMPGPGQVERAAMLQRLVTDLVALFGPAMGGVRLATDIENILLTGLQWRVLLLAASELVFNALLHAFPGTGCGVLTVTFRRTGPRSASLSVSDNGIGYDGLPSAVGRGVVHGLVSLLAGSVDYRRGDCGGTIAQIRFPLDAA